MPSEPATDPGLRTPSVSGLEDQDAHQRVGQDVRLPVPVAIVDEANATRFGLLLNWVWIRGNTGAIGVFGTVASWYLAFASLGTQHPRTAVILIGLLAVFTEERFSAQPIVTNLMRYGMESFDPEAAEKIFAVKAVDPDPIGTAARKVIQEATEAFLESPDYRILKDEIESDVRRQSRREAYLSAGMDDDVRALDVEIREASLEREAKRAKEREERRAKEEPVEPAPEPVERSVEPDTTHTEGVGMPRPEEEPPLEAESGVDPAPVVESTVQGLVEDIRLDLEIPKPEPRKKPRHKKQDP
jgi:hypothetical protein